MSDDSRELSMTCYECGETLTARGDAGPLVLLQRAEQAHDVLNPDCPKRWTSTKPVGEGHNEQ